MLLLFLLWKTDWPVVSVKINQKAKTPSIFSLLVTCGPALSYIIYLKHLFIIFRYRFDFRRRLEIEFKIIRKQLVMIAIGVVKY